MSGTFKYAVGFTAGQQKEKRKLKESDQTATGLLLFCSFSQRQNTRQNFCHLDRKYHHSQRRTITSSHSCRISSHKPVISANLISFLSLCEAKLFPLLIFSSCFALPGMPSLLPTPWHSHILYIFQSPSQSLLWQLHAFWKSPAPINICIPSLFSGHTARLRLPAFLAIRPGHGPEFCQYQVSSVEHAHSRPSL